MALALAADAYWDLCSLSRTITFASVGSALQETGGGCVRRRPEGVAVKNIVVFFKNINICLFIYFRFCAFNICFTCNRDIAHDL